MFNHLFCNKVNIRKVSGYDSYNKPIIDDEIVVNGKLEYETKKVINRNGTEVIQSGELRLKENLNEFDLIEVKGVWREIIDIVPVDDFNGQVQYYIVTF